MKNVYIAAQYGRRLAFDLGTKTGWAASINGCVLSDVLVFTPKPRDGYGKRFLCFSDKVNALITNIQPDMVFYEEIKFSAFTLSTLCAGGFRAHLCAICEKRGIPYIGLDVKSIKKHATGKGNAGKPAMIAAAKKDGWVPQSKGKLIEDEADAYWILKYGLETKG